MKKLFNLDISKKYIQGKNDMNKIYKWNLFIREKLKLSKAFTHNPRLVLNCFFYRFKWLHKFRSSVIIKHERYIRHLVHALEIPKYLCMLIWHKANCYYGKRCINICGHPTISPKKSCWIWKNYQKILFRSSWQ